MIQAPLALVLTAIFHLQSAPAASSGNPEATVVEYLKANVKPGEELVVSKLVNEVFTGAAEQKVLNRLFNTFFKIPLFAVETVKSRGTPPTLKEISDQFAFTVPGEADVILRIMESDPRMPRFLQRDAKTGEILSVNIERVLSHPRFGRLLERTIAGWEGKPAPAFAMKTFSGGDLTLGQLAGKPFLLYFWYSNCEPCVTTSPILGELDKTYRPAGFTIVGVNTDELLELGYAQEARAAYLAKLGLTFTMVHGNAEAQTAYGGIATYPTLFFVDRTGTVVKHLVGGQDRPALEDAIKLALK